MAHDGANFVAPRRSVPCLAAAAALVVSLTACGSSGGSNATASTGAKFSPRVETIVNTSSAGGGADTAIRRLQPMLQEALGSPVSVQDQGGGQGIPAVASLVNKGADCSNMIMTGVPQLNYLPRISSTPFKLSDIYPVASITNQPDVISVPADSPYQSVTDLVNAAKKEPGKIRVSVSQVSSPQYIGMYQLQQSTGSTFNVVQFQGGGPAATALLGGQVEAMAGPMSDATKLGDKVRLLAAFADSAVANGKQQVPTVNDELSISVPSESTYYVLYVTAKCHTQHPDQFDALVNAVKKATSSSAYLDALNKAGQEDYNDIVTAEQFQAIFNQFEQNTVKVFTDNPKIFSGSK